MKERPILFSGAMVRAILDGRKTQTRRIINPQPPFGCSYVINGAQSHALCYATAKGCGTGETIWVSPTAKSRDRRLPCPHGEVGDRLWVREETQAMGHGSVGPDISTKYLADGLVRSVEVTPREYQLFRERKRPFATCRARFMYRSQARIVLELTAVRVERLEDISVADAIADGIEPIEHDGAKFWKNYLFRPSRRRGEPLSDLVHRLRGFEDPRQSYFSLWHSINGPADANPWVWVETFKRV